jgi:hypothetical protein
MAGRGAAPKPQAQRRNHHDPGRGEWRNAPGVGWQHGDQPAPPDGLRAESLEAWSVWMGAWYAAFWSAEDLPALRAMVLLYDQVMRGEYQRHAELRLNLDTWGVTPKGQQDRRWAPPLEAEPVKPQRAARERSRLKAVK